jgi:hypothetical protein
MTKIVVSVWVRATKNERAKFAVKDAPHAAAAPLYIFRFLGRALLGFLLLQNLLRIRRHQFIF